MPTPAENAVLQRAASAIQEGDPVAAWSAMSELRPRLDQDPEIAAAWLALLRQTPARPSVVDEAQCVLARWPEDPTLVTRACDALIRVAERRAPDEPAVLDGAARIAEKAAERCLSAARTNGGDRTLIAYLEMARGNALRQLREFDAALACMQTALGIESERGGFWFNLGLLHKARLAMKEGVAANQRARALLGDEKPVLWNLAICAIGAGEGATAVEALRALGHDAQLQDTGMPIVNGLPPVQVRVATVGSGYGGAEAVPDKSVSFELLWVTPISPCHGVVSAATARDASVDFGDVVLWDAVPVGIGEIEGRPVPRFPLLAVLHRGDERRMRFVALQQASGDVARMGEQLPDGCRMFIHAERVEHVCSRCASGEHMKKHKHTAPEEHRLVYGKIVIPGAIDLPSLRSDLDTLLHKHSGVQLVMPALLEAIGDTQAAGKAHTMWLGLERLGRR